MTSIPLRCRRLLSMAFLAVLIAAGAAPGARAVQPDEVLSNPKLEARAREISRGLRCLVCQNQSIDDSNAPLARDLRLLVRERLLKGDTNAQVITYIHARYGDFVLLKPPLRPYTYLLWFGPPALLIIAVLAILFRVRRRRMIAGALEPPPLTDAEEKRLKDLLGEAQSGDRS